MLRSPVMPPLTVLVLSTPTLPSLRLLEQLPEETRIIVGSTADMFMSSAREADVLVIGNGGHGAFLPVLRQTSSRLKWIHSLSAGVEALMVPEVIGSTVPLTNARGVFARSLAEWAMLGMLYFAKDVPRLLRQQSAHRWEQFDVGELHGATLGIVGYGEIGRATARLAKGFGMEVLALRRRPRLCSDDPLVDQVVPRDRLRELAAASDYLLAAAPLTPETKGLVSADVIAAMKPTAVFLNLGRGPVVDEPALIAALRENRIRGAALDVFETEPLPPGHPLYDLPNVLLSPHSADNTATWLDDTVRFFLENFERFVKGEPLLNVVDKQKGY
ncbi:MAG: D-2-hydroxyacid dehydrogenase [Bryobacteraceae bacterium]|nr:D-2-hydroxyacid dehydrogenase [Bryobacteraceae bacterium]